MVCGCYRCEALAYAEEQTRILREARGVVVAAARAIYSPASIATIVISGALRNANAD